MKAHLGIALATLSLVFQTARGASPSLGLNQVPAEVRKSITAETDRGSVQRIEGRAYNGRTIYKVTFQQPNRPAEEIYYEANGARLPAGALTLNNLESPTTLGLSDLPVAVQRTIDAESGHGPIRTIERVSANGRTMYKVAFQQPNNPDKVVYLEESGAFVRDVPISASPQVHHQFAGTRVPLSDARKVTFSDLPPAVQSTMRKEAGAAPIEEITKGTVEGRVIYEAAFKQDEKNVELRVADDGTVINDPQDRALVARNPLEEARAVTLAELPTAVQSAIRSQAGAVPIERLEKGTLQGKTVYQGEFRRNGQLVRVRVGEDGSIVERPVAAVSTPSP